MKIILRTALLLLSVVIVSSCSSSKQSNYSRAYNAQGVPEMGRGGSIQTSADVNAVRTHNKDCCGTNEATFTADLRTIPKYEGTEYVVETPPVVNIQVIEERQAPQQAPVRPIETRPVAFKKGKLTVVDPRDADKLKLYNAVVVTLSVPANVERLKKKFEEDGDFFFIAKNAKGWFYFIVWSSDDRDEAIMHRHEFVDKYTSMYTHQELLKKYGMPFTDAWIQVNE